MTISDLIDHLDHVGRTIGFNEEVVVRDLNGELKERKIESVDFIYGEKFGESSGIIEIST